MSAQTDLWRLVRRLDEQDGWAVTRTGGGHWKIKGPDVLVYCPQSPSDSRALRNVLARLRREGVPEVVLTGRKARRARGTVTP